MKMSKLLTDYDFEIDAEYYDYILISTDNGQIKQANKLYFDLDKLHQADFIDYIFSFGLEISRARLKTLMKLVITKI